MGGGGRTSDDLEDVQIRVVCRHAAGSQGVLAVAKEVLADLRVAQRGHVRLGAVDAAAGFVDAEDAYGVVGAR